MAEVTDGEVVAIDGNALRRSFAKGSATRAMHMVSAWATANGVGLGHRQVDTKSHDITAIPALLARLELQGGSVTIDAMGCQRDLAQKIVEQGADYVLALKGTQPTRAQAGKQCFLTGPEAETHWRQSDDHEQSARGHGRVETRRAWVSADLDEELRAAAWPGLQSIGLVAAPRTVGEKTSVAPRFSLSSLPPHAYEFAQAVRTHWGIENQLQWTLEVTLREDQSRLRTGYGAENFAVLRPIALNLFRQEPSAKSLPRQRLACALNPDYLLKVLLGE